MILKERDNAETDASDRFAKAGAEGEKQLAFYLRRVFGDNPDVLILNDVRLRVDDGENVDVAQIDHLVIHKHGLIIIESKSCYGEVRVNKQGQWSRTWERRETGFQSPVFQAQLQADLLRKALNAFAEELLGKMLFGKVQKSFRNCPIEILVAISDSGVIKDKADISELLKADQVPARIKEVLERHRKAASIFSMKLDLKSNDGIMDFSAEECRRIADFLVRHHYPRETTAQTRAPAKQEALLPPLPAANSERICPRCGSPMALRTAKKGDNAGNSFWGCSTYPKCRQILPVN